MQLVPGSLRRPTVALLAACVAVTAAAGARVPGFGLPAWLDATFDPRLTAYLGRFPVVLNWLPHLGGQKLVAAMTLTLTLACALARRWRGVVLVVAAVPIAIGLTEYALKPSVPNEGPPGRGRRLVAGLVIAIEPWFLAGGRDMYRIDRDGWTIRSGDGSRAAHAEHTVAVTQDGPRVLTEP